MTTLLLNRKIAVFTFFGIIISFLILKVCKVKEEVGYKSWLASKSEVSKQVELGSFLFRGLPEDHYMYQNAENGISVPFGGKATSIEHNGGNTSSPYTSWTTDIRIAFKYATTDSYGKPCNGIILFKKVDKCTTGLTSSPDFYNEKEILIKNIVRSDFIIYVHKGKYNFLLKQALEHGIHIK